MPSVDSEGWGRWRVIWAWAWLSGLLALLCACQLASPSPPSAGGEQRAELDREAAGRALGLSAQDVDAILAHGPWPQPFTPDPGNRASGQQAAIALGERLFFDPRLSGTGRMACASCHVPNKGLSDALPRSLGNDGQPLDRNAQSLFDARLSHWFGWDGAADSLWAFTLRPLAHPRELALSDAALRTLFASDTGLSCLREAAFGTAQGVTDTERGASAEERLRVQVAKALAAYVETLDSGRTRFDDFRDALERADLPRARQYPAAALRGLQRFVGDGRCNLCHTGPAFSNGEFHDAGRPFMAAPGRPDPGRHAGVQTVLADPYNRLGAWVDPPAQALTDDPAVRTRHLSGSHRNFGEFKVPGLRGAVHTAPYFHDGSAATLDEVVAHYSTLDPERLHADGEAILRPLRLTEQETADLVAFLRTLSEPAGALVTGRTRAGQPTSRIVATHPADRGVSAHAAATLSCPPPARAAP